ncbi:MAG: phosphoribosylformylglycinamidine cyclo-ligase [Candidatus Omnitrophica bacterium]|nr:phosphoribosylformylglycinamidine cyclo-ligase [Candidatus Omnitrophota bacterium]
MRKITYKKSGVDINKAEGFIQAIKSDIKSTLSASVLNRTRAFSSLFSLDKSAYKDPVLVSSCDGVGTKLLVANLLNKHDTVGIDLVAMNVNDILCVGARPLFFLDYIACGKLNPKVMVDVVKGIAEGCRQAGCSLIGGETAEMPGMYKKDDYDLAGFALGVIEKSKIIDGTKIKEGDILIGLPSSGPHSNGYSMIRKALSLKEQKELKGQILAPTKVYVKEVLPLLDKFDINGIAHITGGAFYEKLTKILPDGKCFEVDKRSWKVPEIFRLIQSRGNIEEKEMFRTFNMGIGMVLVVPLNEGQRLSDYLQEAKTKFYRIGKVICDPKRKIIL